MSDRNSRSMIAKYRNEILFGASLLFVASALFIFPGTTWSIIEGTWSSFEAFRLNEVVFDHDAELESCNGDGGWKPSVAVKAGTRAKIIKVRSDKSLTLYELRLPDGKVVCLTWGRVPSVGHFDSRF